MAPARDMKAKLSQNRQEMESLKGSTDAQLENTLEIQQTNRVIQEQLTQAVKEREDATNATCVQDTRI